jgi:hypothetical protein
MEVRVVFRTLTIDYVGPECKGRKMRIPDVHRLAKPGKAEFLQLLRPQRSPLLNIQSVARPSRPAYQNYKKEAERKKTDVRGG